MAKKKAARTAVKSTQVFSVDVFKGKLRPNGTRDWWWHVTSNANGKIVANGGGQGYSRRIDCEDILVRLAAAFPSLARGLRRRA